MNKFLLIAGGIMNVLFMLFHIFLGWQVQMLQGLPAGGRELIQMLNVAVVLSIAFGAYASLFCRPDMMSTRLGTSALALICLIYLSRAAEELILSPQPGIVIFILCLLVAIIYITLIIRKTRGLKSVS